MVRFAFTDNTVVWLYHMMVMHTTMLTCMVRKMAR